MFLQRKHIQEEYLFLRQPRDRFFRKRLSVYYNHRVLKKCSPSTHEGLFLVVPATFPGKQEHLTVCDRSSMRFLLQHLWAAITSHVPPSDKERRERKRENKLSQHLRGDQTEPQTSSRRWQSGV